MEKEKIKTRFISINKEALLSGELKPIDKFLLIILGDRKLIETKDENWYDVDIRPNKLKYLSFIKDTRTLLRSMDRLQNLDFIKYNSDDKIICSNKMLIKVNQGDVFTMVDEEMFHILLNLETEDKKSYQIVILYYLLEYYYNINYGYSSPSRQLIKSSLKADGNKLTKYFEIMHSEMVCEFCQGRFIDFGKRTNNRFIPNTIKYKQGEEDIGMGKRRYKIHKRKGYFY